MGLFDFLFPPRVDELALRAVSLDEFLALMKPRVVPDTRPETIVLLPFNDARVRSALHEAKYRGNERAFHFFGSALADYMRDADDIRTTRFDLTSESSRSNLVVLVPVPLGKERLKERGFNQVHEVILRALRNLGKEGGIKIDSTLLVRTRETLSQVSLPRREREENVRGAFRATRRADPACTYIVIDDVLTTGATLQSAVDALKDAGAFHIIPLALAH
ncbi:MAG: hypothetical protein Q7R59_02325 [bacterium]|nr:hypothetical protein [bacterium]